MLLLYSSYTFEMATNISTYEIYSQNSTAIDIPNEEKDLIISQLKAEIFEKEQTDKNYAILQSQFRNLQNEFYLLCETKLHIEYELRSKEDHTLTAIEQLHMKNQKLISELNDKINLNKKLFIDNENLYRILQLKNSENLTHKDKVKEQEELLTKIKSEKDSNEKKRLVLKQTKENNDINLQKIKNDIDKLKTSTTLNEQNLKTKTEQNEQTIKEYNALKNENDELQIKLQSKKNALNNANTQLKIANENITKLENELHVLSDQLYRNKNDLNELNKNIAKEKAQTDTDAKTKIKMEEDIKEKEIEIENLTKENKEIQIKIEDINKDQPDLTNEVETYRDHILVLSEQNELLSKELETILERDIQLKTILKRTDKLCMTCDENRRIIENSLNNLRAYLDKTECNYKNSKMTPMNKQKYNYNRRNGYDKKKQMYEY